MKKCVVSQLAVPGFDKRIRKQIFAMHRVLKCISYLNSPFDAFFSRVRIYLFKVVKNHPKTTKSLILHSKKEK